MLKIHMGWEKPEQSWSRTPCSLSCSRAAALHLMQMLVQLLGTTCHHLRGSSVPQHPAQKILREQWRHVRELFSCTLTTLAQGKKREAPPQYYTISILQLNLHHFCYHCWLSLYQYHHLTVLSGRSQEVHPDSMQFPLCL